MLSLKDAYGTNASPLRSPLLQGGLCNLGWLPPSWLWSSATCKGRFFSPEGSSASSSSVRTVPCCEDSFYPVFTFLSGVIVPRMVVIWLCSKDKVSSESAYAAFLMRSLNHSCNASQLFNWIISAFVSLKKLFCLHLGKIFSLGVVFKVDFSVLLRCGSTTFSLASFWLKICCYSIFVPLYIKYLSFSCY